MHKRPLMPMASLFAVLLTAAAAQAQQPLGCPAVEEGKGTPVELRIGDFVLRAQVTSDAGEPGEMSRVEGRLIGCENDPRIAPPAGDADDPTAGERAERGFGAMLRLLHDLRIGLELGPTRDGGCVSARLEITDAAGGLAPAEDRPIALELCGFPFDLERRKP
jgi:hypothetical protein